MRALILAERPEGCAKRLHAAGKTGEVADEIAFYLDQAENLDAEADAILAALAERGIDGRIADPCAPDEWMPWAMEAPGCTVLWSVTDGIRYFRGSGVAATARLLGARTFGCGAQAQALAQDKAKTAAIATSLGIQVPPYGLARDGRWLTAPPQGEGPWFVKPNTLGAKIGIWPDSRVDGLEAALALSRRIHARYGDDAVVQPFIAGADVRVSYMAVEADPDFARFGAYRLDTGGRGEMAGAFQTLADSRAVVGQPDRDGRMETVLTDLAGEMPAVNARIGQMLRRVVDGFGLRDLFSLDIRLGEDGTPWLLEFEVCPAVTIFDFKRYLADQWQRDLPTAIGDALLNAMARKPEV